MVPKIPRNVTIQEVCGSGKNKDPTRCHKVSIYNQMSEIWSSDYSEYLVHYIQLLG